jgi:hypothetical protein
MTQFKLAKPNFSLQIQVLRLVNEFRDFGVLAVLYENVCDIGAVEIYDEKLR